MIIKCIISQMFDSIGTALIFCSWICLLRFFSVGICVYDFSNLDLIPFLKGSGDQLLLHHPW